MAETDCRITGGGAAEIIEIVDVKKAGSKLEEIQPRENAKQFREAEFSGGYQRASREKAIVGKFYLEVKAWPGNISKKFGGRNLTNQVSSHFRRANNLGKTVGIDVTEWHGLLYRFTRAGPDNTNFKAYRESLRRRVAKEVRARLKANGLEDADQIKEQVKIYLETKFLVELKRDFD